MQYRVRELRRRKHLSQAELAQLSGVSRATISGIESGAITEVKVGTLVKISAALDCLVGDIFFEPPSSTLD